MKSLAARPSNAQILEAVARHGTLIDASKALGFTRSTFHSWHQQAVRDQNIREAAREVRPTQTLEEKGFIVSTAPDSDLTIEELLTIKRKRFKLAKAKSDWAKLIHVDVPLQGAFGLVVFGDPHLDNDGCDIEACERDLAVITNREAMIGLNLGDITDNWIGRLAAQYAHSATTKDQATKLLEWMLRDRPWLAVIKGNHDLWQGDDLISWALRDSGAIDQSHGVRLALNFKDGSEQIRIHARHDFPGHSQFNPTHGLKRELMMGFRDHLLLAGHRHTDHYQVIANPGENFSSHLCRVSGYKVIDDYADQCRFLENRFNPSVTFVIRPGHRKDIERIKPYWDSEEAADVVAFHRSRGER